MPRGEKKRRRKKRACVEKLYPRRGAGEDTNMSRNDPLMSAFMQLGLVKTTILPCFRRSELLTPFISINAFPCANVNRARLACCNSNNAAFFLHDFFVARYNVRERTRCFLDKINKSAHRRRELNRHLTGTDRLTDNVKVPNLQLKTFIFILKVLQTIRKFQDKSVKL